MQSKSMLRLVDYYIEIQYKIVPDMILYVWILYDKAVSVYVSLS